MVKLAQDNTTPAALRARMYAELATYIAPRRKAVELSGLGGNPIEVERELDLSALSTQELETLVMLLGKAGIGRDE